MKTVFLRLQHALESPVERISSPRWRYACTWRRCSRCGCKKLADMPTTIEWFGNPDWGLGLPFPELLAWLAALSEAGGAVLLLCGLAVCADQPAADGDHADLRRTGRTAGRRSPIRPRRSPTPRCWRPAKLARARKSLREYGNYDWLTSSGSFAIANNGIEFAATPGDVARAVLRRRRQVAFC